MNLASLRSALYVGLIIISVVFAIFFVLSLQALGLAVALPMVCLALLVYLLRGVRDATRSVALELRALSRREAGEAASLEHTAGLETPAAPVLGRVVARSRVAASASQGQAGQAPFNPLVDG